MLIEQKTAGNVQETVGIFYRAEDLQSAIDELLSSGFHRSALSLLASEATVNKALGHQYKKIGALADDPSVPRSAYISPEAIGDAQGGLIGGLLYVGAAVAAGMVLGSGGTIAAGIAAVVVAGGSGGLLGLMLSKWLGSHHSNYLQEQIEHGGLLLWVRTRDGADELRSVEIMKRHSASAVHVHSFTAGLETG